MGVVIPQVVTEDKAGGAQVIDGGLRFTGSSYLKRTPGSAGSSTYTISCWVKRSHLAPDGSGNTNSNANPIFAAGTNAGSDTDDLQFYKDGGGNNNQIRFLAYPGAFRFDLITSMVFRDTSSWYHILANYDGTTAKIYVNGTQVTAFASSTQNGGTGNINTTDQHTIGSTCDGSTAFFRGYLSQFYLIDGQALEPSYFGYTDPLTNTWRPKKLSSSIAFGTNGFYLPFDGNSPIGKDMSGKGNDWTPVNFGGSNTIEKATGALPILNTDGGGKVARVGVRTDSNASSLVLAVPFIGNKSDFSATIKGSGSNKTISGSATNSSSYSQFYGGSVYLDGSDANSLSIASSSDFTPSSGTGFTVEFWFYPTDTDYRIIQTYDNNNSGWLIGYQDFGNGVNGISYNTGAARSIGLVSSSYPANKWYHIAACWNTDNTCSVFVDGVLKRTIPSDFSTSTVAALYLSRQPDSSNLGTQYYMNDLRIYKGLAKYTQNFIPASTDPDILPDTPSGVAYSSNVALVPSTDGGSVAFDPDGDYLKVPASSDLSLTGDFTIEMFIYMSGTEVNMRQISSDGYYTVGKNGNWYFGLNATDTNEYIFYTYDGRGNEEYVNINLPETPALNKWYHLAAVRSGTTVTLYLDGINVGSNTISKQLVDGANSGLVIGKISDGSGGSYGDHIGFISNVHIVKGTALYTSNFTPPTAPISSVANTKLLCCKSNSSATAFDVSPGSITANGNAVASNFNPFTVNINTQRGQESGWCTWNPLDTAGSTLSNGNLNITTPSSGLGATRGTIGLSSGKWYYEHTIISGATAIGIMKLTDILVSGSGIIGASAGGYSYYSEGVAGGGYTKKINNGTQTDYGASFDPGDTISVAFDLDVGTITFYKNGISQGIAFSGLSGTFAPAISDGTNAGSIVGATNFGQKPFKFPPPAGFQPLALANTPRPTIVRPDQYVGIVTYYAADGVAGIATGLSFKPDLVWVKSRTSARSNVIVDSVRGTSSVLWTNLTDAQLSSSQYVSQFNSNGFNYGVAGDVTNNSSLVGWCWKAGGNSNTYNINDVGYATASAAGLASGTITPTGASVNTKSGFSIITYNGNLTTTGNSTVGHGLGLTPAFWISKSRSSTGDDSGAWVIWHKNLSSNTFLRFSTATPQSSDGTLTQPTSSVFTTTWNSGFNVSGNTYVAYIWAEIPGFSKFGSYTGNNSTDGVYVHLGFRPKFLIVKCTQDIAGDVEHWIIRDSTRSTYNPTNANLYANLSNAEDDASGFSGSLDLLSNGFKMRGTYGGINASATYIYAAWAETPSFNLYGGQANAR